MKTFEKKLLFAFPLENWRERRVCLAVSGGADSVALLCGFARIAETEPNRSRNLLVVSVDHRSRGAESDGDVEFVRELAASFGLEFVRRTVDPDELRAESRRQGSWESAARTIRYRLLADSARRASARFLATAHHRDDQLETLLFRLFRGAGFDGLRGMAPARPLDESTTLIRPLLGVGRAEILDYLRELGQPFRTDSSNESPKFARNRIRRELAPLLESIFPGRWENSLLRLAHAATETEAFFDEKTKSLEAKIDAARRRDAAFRRTLESLDVAKSVFSTFLDPAETSSDVVRLPLEPLRSAPEPVVRRYFRKVWRRQNWPLDAMGADEWRRLTDAAREKSDVETPPAQFPGDVFLTFPDRTTLRLARRTPTDLYSNAPNETNGSDKTNGSSEAIFKTEKHKK